MEEWLSRLVHLDPAAWGLLASIVTVFVGIPTIISIIRHQAKERADAVTASAKADVTNTNKNEMHVHVPPPQVIRWPSQPPVVPPASPPITEEPLPPSPTLPETPPALVEQVSSLPETLPEPMSPPSEVIAPPETLPPPETPPIPPETPSLPLVPDEPVPVPPAPNSDPGVTYFQNMGVREQVESPRVQPTEVEPKVELEPAPQSGKLAADHIARRESLRAVLRNASYLVQEIRTYADKYGRPSQSDQPYRNNVRLHRALLEYLKATQVPIFRLNAALNKLSLAAWSEKDPRQTFFAALDPLSIKTPAQVRQAFSDTLEAMVKTVREMGYTVTLREEPLDPEFPNRKWTYHLTRARNPKLESFEVQDDEREEEVDEALEDELNDDA